MIYEKPDECIICLEKFDEKDDKPLSCGHWVHESCIIAWGKRQCPICRQFIILFNDVLECSTISSEPLIPKDSSLAEFYNIWRGKYY